MVYGSGIPESILTDDSGLWIDGMPLHSQLGLVLV